MTAKRPQKRPQKASTKKPLFQVAPELRSCPRCRLGLEAGTNPDGLVWHQCRDGVELQLQELLTQEGLLDKRKAEDILVRLLLHRALVDVSPVQQLAAGIKALTDAGKRGPPAGPSDAMKAFLSGPRGRG